MQNRKRDTDVQNRLLDSVGEGEGGMLWQNSTETSILSRVKQITSPGWRHETSAQGWCTGKTQKDGMGREVVGGIRWGTHVNPKLIHVNVWQKPLQYCKVISLQLIKINEKKKKKRPWCWERLMTGQEEGDRGWDGWMASPTQWTWVWANSVSWWWTGKPCVLQSMVSQRVRHNLATEEQW